MKKLGTVTKVEFGFAYFVDSKKKTQKTAVFGRVAKGDTLFQDGKHIVAKSSTEGKKTEKEVLEDSLKELGRKDVSGTVAELKTLLKVIEGLQGKGVDFDVNLGITELQALYNGDK
jgi:hypothetical protein